ncbi:hypothetical protein XPA_008958 [Xanthoria parietina]
MKTDHAFNYHAIAYDHGIEDRQKHVRLRVRNLSSNKPPEAASGQAPSVRPTAEELDLNIGDGGDCLVLWIGMAPTTETGTKGKKGIAISSLEDPHLLPHEPNAQRVVVSATSTKMTHSYVLVDQVDGLCDGYRVALDKCHFFSEFRDDDLTAAEKQRSTWSAIIREHISGSQSKASGPSSISKSHNRAEIRVPWLLSRTYEIKALAAQYCDKREPWILKELYQIATSIDPDYTHAPPPKNVGIRALSDTRIEIFPEDAIDIVEEIERCVLASIMSQRDWN